jgi:hypothetical protein
MAADVLRDAELRQVLEPCRNAYLASVREALARPFGRGGGG